MPRLRFLPIDLSQHFDVCVEFLTDAFSCSYGDTEMLAAIGGAPEYRRGLERLLSVFPQGAVHLWRDAGIVGQVELNLRGSVGHVNLLYLVPELRGSGLGELLHTYTVNVLRAHRVVEARLAVGPGNVRAMRYYSKHGWRDLGPRPDRPYVHGMTLDIAVQPEKQ